MIVAFGVGSVAFAASSISFCRRGIAAPAYPLNAGLQSRHASCAPEKSHGSPANACPHQLPSPASHAVEHLGPPECCKLVRCLLSALIQLILQFRVLHGQTLQRSRELLMHRPHGVFRHLGLSGTRCLSIDSVNQLGFQLRGVQASTQAPPVQTSTLARIPRIST